MLESPGFPCERDTWRNHSAFLCLSLLICKPGTTVPSSKVIVTSKIPRETCSTQYLARGKYPDEHWRNQQMKKWKSSSCRSQRIGQSTKNSTEEKTRASFSSYPCSLSFCVGLRWARRAMCEKTQCWKAGFSGLLGTHERKGMQCFSKLVNQIG